MPDPAPKRGRPPIGVRVPVRFPAATLARIEALAAKDGVSRAEMIRRLVDRGLKKPPDIDDMLAWLRERDIDWCAMRNDNNPDIITVTVWRPGFARLGTDHDGPTLHAALEAAVRAVAAESPAPQVPGA